MKRRHELIVKRAVGTVPEQDEAKLIAKRLKEWEEEYFRFIESGIEPRNNEAEITIRQTVLDRVVTQGSRGIRGNERHERFWTVLTTCGLQGTPVMHYLKSCLSAYFGWRTSFFILSHKDFPFSSSPARNRVIWSWLIAPPANSDSPVAVAFLVLARR
jgi:hypothetical protein